MYGARYISVNGGSRGPDRVDRERLDMGDIGIFEGIFGSTCRDMRAMLVENKIGNKIVIKL